MGGSRSQPVLRANTTFRAIPLWEAGDLPGAVAFRTEGLERRCRRQYCDSAAARCLGSGCVAAPSCADTKFVGAGLAPARGYVVPSGQAQGLPLRDAIRAGARPAPRGAIRAGARPAPTRCHPGRRKACPYAVPSRAGARPAPTRCHPGRRKACPYAVPSRADARPAPTRCYRGQTQGLFLRGAIRADARSAPTRCYRGQTQGLFLRGAIRADARSAPPRCYRGQTQGLPLRGAIRAGARPAPGIMKL